MSKYYEHIKIFPELSGLGLMTDKTQQFLPVLVDSPKPKRNNTQRNWSPPSSSSFNIHNWCRCFCQPSHIVETFYPELFGVVATHCLLFLLLLPSSFGCGKVVEVSWRPTTETTSKAASSGAVSGKSEPKRGKKVRMGRTTINYNDGGGHKTNFAIYGSATDRRHHHWRRHRWWKADGESLFLACVK